MACLVLLLFVALSPAFAQTVNLNNYFTATPPAGSELKFYTGLPFGPATEVPSSTVVAAPPGTYYAVYKGIGLECFSPYQKITITTNVDCTIPDTVDLTTYSTGVTPPPGSVLEWHTGLPTSSTTLVSNPSAISVSGTYYAVFRAGEDGDICYSPASDPIIVIIRKCQLPVKLISFAAAVKEQTTVLTWATVEETNSDRFEVEKSSDSKNWIKVGTKSSAGESKGNLNYSFVDQTPAAGINYYRLKMIDKDATFAYSSIVHVNFVGELAYVYPNPTSGLLKFNASGSSYPESAQLLNTSGKAVYEFRQIPADGIQLKGVVSKGIYLLKISHNDGTQATHKIIVSD
jgi:hypothetical protein